MQQLAPALVRRATIIGALVIICGVDLAFGQSSPIPQSGWTLHWVDSQEAGAGGYLATNAFDGNPATMWHTQWVSGSPSTPHEIQINLGGTYNVSGFRYLPRQDGRQNGNIAQYEFYVSADGVNWGGAVATGTFPSGATERQVAFTAKTGRYVRLRALTEVNGNPWSAAAELNVLATSSGSGAISKAGWTLQSVDSQESEVGSYLAVNAFDGNPATMWHTQWASNSPPPPHDIRINLGATHSVSGFRYLPRQDGRQNGNIAQYEFYVSADGVNWGAAVAIGTFPRSAAQQEVVFPAKSGRYVRLRALSEINGQPWTAVAELDVLAGGSSPGNQPPESVISSPGSDQSIVAGQSVSFAGSGSDPDGNLPLTYTWTFPGGSPASSSSQNPGSVSFLTAGTYSVSFTVRDSQGLFDPTPATRTITVLPSGGSGSGATLLPQSGWRVAYVDSEEQNVAGFLAASAFDGNPSTAWSTRWWQGGPPPPHDLVIDIGSVQTLVGFRYLPFNLWQQGRIGDYEFYVSTDNATWGAPVAAGSFPDLNTATAEDVRFAPAQARYVWLRTLSEVNRGDYRHATVAELNLWRAGSGANQPPTVSITAPTGNLTVRAGSAVRFSASASDADGHLPLSARWSFGPGSGIADITQLDPGGVNFDRPGTFTVTLTVADALGAAVSTTRTVTVTAGTVVPRAGWSVVSATPGNSATNAFDGNSGTFWMTQDTSPFPHEVVIDLGTTRQLTGFRYQSRQDGLNAGNVDQYQFFVSADGVQWGAPVAEGRFDNTQSRKEIAFAAKTGRYIRFRALSDLNWWNFVTVAELDVLQHQCVAPSLRLLSPVSGAVQPSGLLTMTVDACVSSGQGVKGVVDGISAGIDYVAPFEVVASLAGGDHVVETYIVDASGNPVAGDSTYDRSAPVGIGDTYVAIGDGITTGYSDDVATDDNSTDRRNLQGGYTPILGDLLTAARGYPVSVINQGIGGSTVRAHAAVIDSLLQKYPNTRAFLLVSGHNEAQEGMPSGRGLIPGSPGYANSFKDYTQRIITAVRAAGKRVILAKAPPVVGTWGGFDPAIRDYNMVIDELVADPANGILAVPPDFYSYFSGKSGTHYGNEVEMNGRGYQDMAALWRQAILGAP